MKLLTPQSLAAAVIGRGGSTIVEMERSAQANIWVSKVNELYPQSDCRVLTARADSESALNEVARQVVGLVVEVFSRAPAERGMDESQLRTCMLVPSAVAMSLLADSGKGVRELCESSGVMVKIKDPVSGSHGPEVSQEVLLRGRPQMLEAAIREVNREVQLLNDEPWFVGWSQPIGDLDVSSSPTVKDGGVRLEPRRRMEAGSEDGGVRSEPRRPSPESERVPHGQVLSGWKVLTPPALARALSKAALSEVEQRTQAKVCLSEPDETYPRTESRMLTARAATKEPLEVVLQWVAERLDAVAAGEPANDDVVWEGNLKLSFAVPKACAAAIIGRGGSMVRQLQEQSGASIKVRDYPIGVGPDATQKVDVRGSAKSIEQVLCEVNSLTQQVREEAWFHSWASAPGLPVAGKSSSESSRPARAPSSPAVEKGKELVGRIMDDLPPYVIEESRGFAVRFSVPNWLVDAVVGRNKAGLQEVQRQTKTKIVMRNDPEDADHELMNISGPLLNICSAYMLMMKRYLDAEKETGGG